VPMAEVLSLQSIVGDGPVMLHVIVELTTKAGVSIYDDPANPPAPSTLPLGAITITANQVRG